MQRLWSKNATGVAPDGRWYAGDVNQLQDAVAAQSDFLQFIDLAGLRIGETGLQLIRYGPSEARLAGAMRVDGIMRALGGLYAGAFTTTQRDAIPAGFRPFGLVILNTSTARLEVNLGSDPTPSWLPVGVDPAGTLTFAGQPASNFIITAARTGDSQPRLKIREDGRIEWGVGSSATDTFLSRTAAGQLSIGSNAVVTADDAGLANNVKILAKPDPFDIAGTTTETNLINFTVPGGSMGTRGELHYYLVARFGHPSTQGGLVMTVRLYWGGTLVGSILENSSGSNQTVAPGRFEFFLRNNGSNTNQRIVAWNEMPAWGGGSSSANFAATKDTTANQDFRVTAQLASAAGGYSLEIYSHILERR